MADTFYQLLFKESPYSRTWTQRQTAFDPRRRYFYYSNAIKEDGGTPCPTSVSTPSSFSTSPPALQPSPPLTTRPHWKKKIKVLYLELEAEKYAVPVGHVAFNERMLYTVHLCGYERPLESAHPTAREVGMVKRTGARQGDAKGGQVRACAGRPQLFFDCTDRSALAPSASSVSVLRDGGGGGGAVALVPQTQRSISASFNADCVAAVASPVSFTADDIYLSPLYPKCDGSMGQSEGHGAHQTKKKRKLGRGPKGGEEVVSKWTFRANNFASFERFIRRVHSCLVVHGCMPSLHAGLPPYDPRNGIYFGLVPLYLLHRFNMLRDVVFYDLQPGLLLMINPLHRKLYGVGTYMCISHDMVLCLKGCGSCPRWATISEIASVQYSLSARRPFLAILTRDSSRPDILFTPVAEPFPPSARKSFDARRAVQRIAVILQTLLTVLHTGSVDSHLATSSAQRAPYTDLRNDGRNLVEEQGGDRGGRETRSGGNGRGTGQQGLNPSRLASHAPDGEIGVPRVRELSDCLSVFDYLRECGAGRPLVWRSANSSSEQVVRLVTKQALAEALGIVGIREGSAQDTDGCNGGGDGRRKTVGLSTLEQTSSANPRASAGGGLSSDTMSTALHPGSSQCTGAFSCRSLGVGVSTRDNSVFCESNAALSRRTLTAMARDMACSRQAGATCGDDGCDTGQRESQGCAWSLDGASQGMRSGLHSEAQQQSTREQRAAAESRNLTSTPRCISSGSSGVSPLLSAQMTAKGATPSDRSLKQYNAGLGTASPQTSNRGTTAVDAPHSTTTERGRINGDGGHLVRALGALSSSSPTLGASARSPFTTTAALSDVAGTSAFWSEEGDAQSSAIASGGAVRCALRGTTASARLDEDLSRWTLSLDEEVFIEDVDDAQGGAAAGGRSGDDALENGNSDLDLDLDMSSVDELDEFDDEDFVDDGCAAAVNEDCGGGTQAHIRAAGTSDSRQLVGGRRGGGNAGVSGRCWKESAQVQVLAAATPHVAGRRQTHVLDRPRGGEATEDEDDDSQEAEGEAGGDYCTSSGSDGVDPSVATDLESEGGGSLAESLGGSR